MLRGSLFSKYFRDEGLSRMADAPSAEEVATFADAARDVLAGFPTQTGANEATTEARLIFKIFTLLGFDFLPQPSPTRRRDDIPDAVLMPSKAAADAALANPDFAARFRAALIVAESKAWDVPLDQPDKLGRSPATQARRYLRSANETSDGKVAFALLSNGRLWRIYRHGVANPVEQFFEADLTALLEPGGEAALATFYRLFRRAAFEPDSTGRCFFDAALAEAREWQEALTTALARGVFNEVFPDLLAAISRADLQADPASAAWPEAVREAALVLLYRLLFLLYAESRDLLPMQVPSYEAISLNTMRDTIEDARENGRAISETGIGLWQRLLTVFRAIGAGNDALGMPPYNGSLFREDRAPVLNRVALTDAVLAGIIDKLSRAAPAGRLLQRVNYRELSVQHLGAIYEKLLECAVTVQSGVVLPEADDEARHGIGAYYTTEELVSLTLGQAVDPLVTERRGRFDAGLERVKAQPRRALDERIADLRRHDTAHALLSLKVLDPAMGSGHFLVSLVDLLSQEALLAMEEAPALAAAAGVAGYVSPIAEELERERAGIKAAAGLHNWPLDETLLENRHLIRRLTLKRVAYGVDANPLAVELAKLSLWLHSFTCGAPLSFLDHHLRCGDSLTGAWLQDTHLLTEGRGRSRSGGLFLSQPIASARGAAQGMARIENLPDADMAQWHESNSTFAAVRADTAPLVAFLDLWHAARVWHLPALPTKGGLRAEAQAAMNLWLDGQCGDPVQVALNGPLSGLGNHRKKVASLLAALREIARERGFFHWQPGFPGVWPEWLVSADQGGFDAVVGNPPYVRQEKIKPIKPGLKARFKSYDGTADLYVYFVEQALRLLRPGGRFGLVLTNKWAKAEYAAGMRQLLGEEAWLEQVTDFGHAKGFFPGTDVFPSVLTARRPIGGEDAPEETRIAVLPRETVRYAALRPQVAEAAFPLPRAHFVREPWMLLPPDEGALLRRLRETGRPLTEYAGVKPYRGVLTGFNEAFVVNQAERDALVARDPRSAELLRPFLRGQDIGRWAPDWAGQWMLRIDSSENRAWPWAGLLAHEACTIFSQEYPAVAARMKGFEAKLRKREDQGRFWWELRSCAYYSAFEEPKIVYQEIQYHSAYCLEVDGQLLNNKGFLLAIADPWILSILNSPMIWWYGWRYLPHMKDEALSPVAYRMEGIPITTPSEAAYALAAKSVAALHQSARARHQATAALRDWLAVNFDLARPNEALQSPFALSQEGFIAAIRAALPTARRNLSSAAIHAIRAEHADTIQPIAAQAAANATLEASLARQVEQAFGMTEAEVALMWRTAPPRMPGTPSGLIS